jgi:hypothetical protein
MRQSDVSNTDEASPPNLPGTHEPEPIGRPAHLRNVGVSFGSYLLVVTNVGSTLVTNAGR